MRDLLNALGNVCSVALGLVQLYAITLGISAFFGWHWVIALIIAIFIAPVPILGTVGAMWAGMHVWHWSLGTAAEYLLIPLAAVIILTGSAGGLSTWSKMRNP